MSMVHVAYGDTYKHKRTLSQKKFRFHYGDKVWIRFIDPSLDDGELEKHVRNTQKEIEELEGVHYTQAQSSFYDGTSVDPYISFSGEDPSSGFRVPKVEKDQEEFSIKAGDRIEIKSWLAKKLQEDTGEDIFFRNLEIVETLRETYKAVHCRIKFISDIAESCHLCGRSLDDPISVATGIGPVCLKKIGIKRVSADQAKEVLKEIDKICKDIGEIGPVWIAKSQIKRNIETKEVKENTSLCQSLRQEVYNEDDQDKDDYEEWKRQKEKFAQWELEQERQAFSKKMSMEGA